MLWSTWNIGINIVLCKNKMMAAVTHDVNSENRTNQQFYFLKITFCMVNIRRKSKQSRNKKLDLRLLWMKNLVMTGACVLSKRQWYTDTVCNQERAKRLFRTNYDRGRQSPARRPNPAREFCPSSPRRLVSFNIKFGPENVPNDERLFSRWAWFSRTLIVNADRLSYARWRWLTPFTLDPSVTSLVKLGHFLVKLEKNSIKLKTGGVDLKTILNKIPKISTYPLSASADVTWHHDEGGRLVHSNRY